MSFMSTGSDVPVILSTLHYTLYYYYKTQKTILILKTARGCTIYWSYKWTKNLILLSYPMLVRSVVKMMWLMKGTG